MEHQPNPDVEIKYLDPRYHDVNYPEFKPLAYESAHAAAMDLRAALGETITLNPGECKLIGTGVAIYMRNPYMAAHILPRSGLGHKHGIVLGNLVGEIDADYQGELKVSVWNRSNAMYVIDPGDRIAQIEFVPILRAVLKEVSEFTSETDRGEGGFGSSGKQ